MPKIPASERDAFYASRRSELAAVALELWAERGFDATPVEAIARGAGISKGTFYLYFESKQALLEEVMRRHSLVPVVEALAANLRGATLEQAVHTLVRAAWQHLCERRDLVLLVLRELPTHLEEAQQVIENVLVPANRQIAAYLEDRVGAERAGEISLLIAGRSFLGSIVFAFLTHEVLGMKKLLPVSAEQLTATLAETFLRGVIGGAAAKEDPA